MSIAADGLERRHSGSSTTCGTADPSDSCGRASEHLRCRSVEASSDAASSSKSQPRSRGRRSSEREASSDAGWSGQSPPRSRRRGSDEESARNYAKWHHIMEQGVEAYQRDQPLQFQRRVLKGIPARFRWRVWKALTTRDGAAIFGDSDSEQLSPEQEEEDLEETFEEFSNRENPPWTSRISIDIHRTFPENPAFDESQQMRLFRVLNAYAAFNPDLGYCQGMNFVVGMLILVAGPDVAAYEIFRVLVGLMHELGLVGFYCDDLPLLKRYVSAHEELLKEVAPDLRAHFLKENVQPAMYLHQWFLTLFVSGFPIAIVVIIWDAILLEGLPTLLRAGVSLLMVLKNHLLSMHMEDIILFLKKMKTFVGNPKSEQNSIKTGQILVKHMGNLRLSSKLLEYLYCGPLMDKDQLQPSASWFSSTFSNMLQW